MILPHSPFLNKLVYLLNEIKNICFSNINRDLLQLRLTNSMMMGEKNPPNVNLFVFIVSDFIIFEKSLIFLKFSTIFIQYEKKNVCDVFSLLWHNVYIGGKCVSCLKDSIIGVQSALSCQANLMLIFVNLWQIMRALVMQIRTNEADRVED